MAYLPGYPLKFQSKVFVNAHLSTASGVYGSTQPLAAECKRIIFLYAQYRDSIHKVFGMM